MKLSASVPDMRKKAEGRGLEKEEEDYFNERYYVFCFVIDCLFCLQYSFAECSINDGAIFCS